MVGTILAGTLLVRHECEHMDCSRPECGCHFRALQAQGVLMSLNHDSQGLGLAATYLNSEFYTMVGENGTTPDGYASGVADLDCFENGFSTSSPTPTAW